jgi:hypothetical protein
MTAKNKLGGALINYGDDLPSTGSSPDGALFLKTGASEGLYIYRLIADQNPGSFGNQSGASWSLIASTASGVDADTLNGLPASAFQLASTELTGLSGLSTLGLMVRTGAGTYATRQLSGDATIQVGPAGNEAGGVGNFTLSVNQGALDLSSIGGSLGIAKGGTGLSTAPAAGSVIFSNGATFAATAVGTAPSGSGTAQTWQVLTSAGSGTPAWVNATSLNVAYAAQAGSAASATSATSATSVAWSGITGLPTALQDFPNTPSAGFSIRSSPSNFYVFPDGAASLGPQAFQQATISAYDAYAATDIPGFSVGLTVAGAGSPRGAQLNFVWNSEENPPSGALSYRVNDDTSDIAAWSPWRTVWDQGNLTSVSQLTNDLGFITSSSLTAYVQKAGDTMTGNLVIQSPNTLPLTLRGAATSAANFVLQSNATSGTAYWLTAKTDGTLHIGGVGSSEPSGVIVISGTDATFAGNVVAAGNVTAFSPSDARLKKNVEVIAGALDKVKRLRGVSYTLRDRERQEVGLIAQELKEVVPEVVRMGADGFYGVQYGNLVGLLVEAIKEQQVQIDELKARLS